MITTCPKCQQEYDDTYNNTQCPHEYFQMHCGVLVNGKEGCAHTVEEQALTTHAPNPDCEDLKMLHNIAEALKEKDRLKKLSNEDLVKECLKDPETDCLIVEEMCNRLFPDWSKEEEIK